MKSVVLGEVAKIERAVVDPATLDRETPYLGLEHIARGGEIVGRGTVGGAELASAKHRFDEGHVLFGKLRPNLGKIARPSFSGVCSTDILPIRPAAGLDRNYLVQYLRQPSMVDYAATRATGANLPRLSPGVLAAFEVPLPPIEEQRRIAAILDQADAIRTKRRQAIARLGGLPQAMLRPLLESCSDRVPFGSLMLDGPKNGMYLPRSEYGSGTPIVRIDSIRFGTGEIDSSVPLKRLRASARQVAEFGLAVGDIVINRVNSTEHVGKAALVRALSEPIVYESNMMRVRLDAARVEPEFVAAFLQTADVRAQFAPMVKPAVNQSSINQADVRSLRVPVPPISAQKDFAAQVRRVARHRSVVERALAADDELFASLQFRAFRGEL